MSIMWALGALDQSMPEPRYRELAWSLCGGALNVLTCGLAWYRGFANQHLPWAAMGTWVLLNIQGR